MRRGRRSQQALAVSLRTALGTAGEGCGLLNGNSALRARLSWQERSARHSRLVVDEALSLERRLSDPLAAVLGDLAVVLAKLPADRPLALLLETSSANDCACLNGRTPFAWICGRKSRKSRRNAASAQRVPSDGFLVGGL